MSIQKPTLNILTKLAEISYPFTQQQPNPRMRRSSFRSVTSKRKRINCDDLINKYLEYSLAGDINHQVQQTKLWIQRNKSEGRKIVRQAEVGLKKSLDHMLTTDKEIFTPEYQTLAHLITKSVNKRVTGDKSGTKQRECKNIFNKEYLQKLIKKNQQESHEARKCLEHKKNINNYLNIISKLTHSRDNVNCGKDGNISVNIGRYTDLIKQWKIKDKGSIQKQKFEQTPKQNVNTNANIYVDENIYVNGDIKQQRQSVQAQAQAQYLQTKKQISASSQYNCLLSQRTSYRSPNRDMHKNAYRLNLNSSSVNMNADNCHTNGSYNTHRHDRTQNSLNSLNTSRHMLNNTNISCTGTYSQLHPSRHLCSQQNKSARTIVYSNGIQKNKENHQDCDGAIHVNKVSICNKHRNRNRRRADNKQNPILDSNANINYQSKKKVHRNKFILSKGIIGDCF